MVYRRHESQVDCYERFQSDKNIKKMEQILNRKGNLTIHQATLLLLLLILLLLLLLLILLLLLLLLLILILLFYYYYQFIFC